MMRNLDLRFSMCSDFVEGTEIGDAVEALVTAVERLKSINAYERAEIVLSIAAGICKEHVEWLQTGCGDYEEYKRFPDHVFEYFAGEKKVSKKKFSKQMEE